MSAAGAIRAGAAYIEVFLEQNRLAQSITSVQTKLRGMSATLSKMGSAAYGGGLPGPLGAIAHFATSPAGMFAGLITAAKSAATFGTELDILAQKTGLAHEVIGSLDYAAKQSGVSTEQLGVGIRQLAKNTIAAARGSKEQAEAFGQLGVEAASFAGLSPDEQFRLMADKLKAIENPTLRAALAMKIFGRSGVDLMPLIDEGAEGIAKLQQQAHTLGLTMGGEEAKRLREFGDRMDDLWLVVKRGIATIGSAVAPEIRKYTVRLVEGFRAARDWIESHRGLVVVALQATGAIVAGGLALTALGKILGLVAGGVGLLITPFRIAGSIVSAVGSIMAMAMAAGSAAISTAGATLGFLLTPMGLLMGGAVALAGYFLWSSGAIAAAMDWLKGVFSGLADDAKKAFGGIGDALAAGDMALAAKVLWATLKLEWQKGLAFLEGLWEGFKGFWSDAVLGLGIIFTGAVAKVKTLWAEMIGWMQKKWEAFKLSGFTEYLASWFAPIFAKLQGVSVEDAQKALKEDFAAGRKRQPQRDAEIDADTKRRTTEIEQERQGTVDQLGQEKLSNDKARQSRIDAIEGEVDRARAERDQVLAQARDARDQAVAAGPGAPRKPGYAAPEGLADIGNLAAEKASTVGTFSGYALAGFGPNSVWDKMESHLFEISGSTTTMASKMQSGTDDGGIRLK